MQEVPWRLGYRMPAEWERHQATWLSWPKDPDTFPPAILPRVEAAYAEMARALSRDEEVRILVDGEKGEARASSVIGVKDNVAYVRVRTVDVWVRDYGPTYVSGKDLALVKWRFNAWGRKYDDLMPDDESGEKIAASTGLRIFRPGCVMEGGSFDSNGRGSLITTEQCLLNRNRNPGFGKGRVEEVLRDYLGASNVLWLKGGIEGDDTDGHVDDVARFVGPRTVAVASEPEGGDPNSRTLAEGRALLEEAKDEEGRGLEVLDVPMPPRVDGPDGRLPASHLNFYVGNGVVLVPTFGGESDAAALGILGRAFPGREVVGVDCRALVYGLGTIHCVTQQVPSVR